MEKHESEQETFTKEEYSREESSEQQKRFEIFTKTPVRPLVLKLAVPTILGMLVTTIYNLTDTFFISQLGQKSMTAAIGIIFSFFSLIQAIGFMFGHGSGNYISRQLGKHKVEDAKNMAATGFFSSFFTGIVIMVFAFLFQKPLVVLLGGGGSEALFQNSLEYLEFLLFSIPFMVGSLTLNNQLRLQGNAKDGIFCMVSGMILNMILDPVFIFIGGMELRGAALATLIGQMVTLVLLYGMTRKKDNIGIEWKRFSVNGKNLKQILFGGAPNLLRQGIGSVSGILLNHAAAVYGESMIAAFTVSSRVLMLVFGIVIGFGQGFQPVCGYNYGAKIYQRVKDAFVFSIRVTTIFLLFMMAVLFLSAEPVMHLFSKEADVAAYGVSILRYQCISFPLMGFYILVGMLLQNIGKFGKASVCAAARQGIFLLPAILILPYFLGITGLFLCQPVADVLSAGLAFWMIRAI